MEQLDALRLACELLIHEKQAAGSFYRSNQNDLVS
jgi:hypothetical protein